MDRVQTRFFATVVAPEDPDPFAKSSSRANPSDTKRMTRNAGGAPAKS
jgi:hypothetical protein